MLLLQGMDDKVVPPNQAFMMADAVRRKRLPVALLTFEGEWHGFRMVETIVATLEAQISLFAQVFGFTPANDVPEPVIDNLPPDPGVDASRSRQPGSSDNRKAPAGTLARWTDRAGHTVDRRTFQSPWRSHPR
jgi:hypothetical protein